MVGGQCQLELVLVSTPVLLSGSEPPHPVVAAHCWVNPAGHGIGQLIHRDLVCIVTRWEIQVVLQLHGNH